MGGNTYAGVGSILAALGLWHIGRSKAMGFQTGLGLLTSMSSTYLSYVHIMCGSDMINT